MTTTAHMRLIGFKEHLAKRGLLCSANLGVDYPPVLDLTIVVEEQPVLPDVTGEAKAKTPVYVNVHALVGAMDVPRAVESFTTAEGRKYTVIEFKETPADAVKWIWFCEGQRVQM